MASPIPKRPDQRQRRNRTTNAATLEAPAARKVPLPTRYSAWRCDATVDAKDGCRLTGAQHDLEHFAKAEIEPHEFVPREIEWRPMTLAWWETIWASPMAHEWVDADVPGLLALAALVDGFWSTGDAKIAAEIRLQQREYGLSPLSRRQLQWEIKRVETGRPAPAAPPRRHSARSVLGVLEGGRQTA